MDSLKKYGWNSFHQQNYDQLANKQPVGRVVSIQGFKYHVVSGSGELETELAGRLLYGSDPEDLPKVGDWVCYLDYGSTGYIVDLLPRQNALSRRSPGTRTERQVLATNIDFALVVQGLDGNFNIMRLERYLAQVIACRISPIVVLNKADLSHDNDTFRKSVVELQRDCPVFFCSALTGKGMTELAAAFESARTYIMIGSSGVGKSSLLNWLTESSIQRTKSISGANAKGRHTTTTRDLFELANGSLLIDTPGMREFGFTSEEGRDATLFPGMSEFAARCRYADCVHLSEPGCAVLEALQAGQLSATTYESYVKLMKEQKRFEVRVEDKKRLGKQSGRMAREANNYRKKNKY